MTPGQTPEIIKWTASPDDSGKRLDQLVTTILPGCTRNTAARMIRDGSVLVNKAKKKPGYRLTPGDTVSAAARVPEQEQHEEFIPEPLDIDVVFKDPSFIIINKPPGLVVHPAAGNFSGTLAHGLAYHFPELRQIDRNSTRPGIVHRLDKDTSGIMVIARNISAWKNLASQFKARTVEKTYTALIHGIPEHDQGRIVLPVYRHPVHRKKMATGGKNNDRARYAETIWKVKEKYGNLAMMECTIKTGRTHQIRVHLSSIGHPVIGDRVYGYKRPLRHYQDCTELAWLLSRVPRQMLHSGKIGFIHPEAGNSVSFTVSLPADMQDLRKTLLEYAKE